MSPDPRLVRLLGTEELGWLVQRARHRLERARPLTGTVTHARPTLAERDATARLLGRRLRPGTALTVQWEAVDEVLRRSGVHPAGLASAVVALTGPVLDRATEASARDEAWRRAFAPLDAVVAARPVLAEWAAGLQTTGVVRRLAGTAESAGELLDDLAAVLTELPAHEEPIGRFAERVLGNAHALDDDRPVSTLAFGAARALGGVGDGSGTSWRRAVWAAVGLHRDDLSSTVLALGLPGDPGSPTGRALGQLGAAGEPAVLTLRQLVRDPPTWEQLAGHTVSVCENPIVVAMAADRLGAAAGPLVCVSGQPGAAAIQVLRLVSAAGARLRYHGDFDWGGLRIGNVLFSRFPMAPWRFDADAFHAAADVGRPAGRPLTGTPVEAIWDPGLAAAMSEAGHAVEEERVAELLVADLQQRARDCPGRQGQTTFSGP